MPKLLRLDDNTEIDVAEQPVFRGGIWECGDQRFTDPQGDQYEAVPLSPAVPNSVTRFQAKAALSLAGKLAEADALLTRQDTHIIARLAWADALEFFRESPTVAAMSSALAMTSDEVDQLFITASGISA